MKLPKVAKEDLEEGRLYIYGIYFNDFSRKTGTFIFRPTLDPSLLIRGIDECEIRFFGPIEL